MAQKHESLVNDILRTYGANPAWRIWPNNTGTAYRGQRLIRYGKVGSADIMGILADGRMVCIEVKVGRDTQSEAQRNFEAVIKRYNGVYFVARSLDAVARFLHEITNPG